MKAAVRLARRVYRRLPDWAQGLVLYVTGVAVICGLPLLPAWLILLIHHLVTGR